MEIKIDDEVISISASEEDQLREEYEKAYQNYKHSKPSFIHFVRMKKTYVRRG